MREINGCILRTCTGNKIFGICTFICMVTTASPFYTQGLSSMRLASAFLLLLRQVHDLVVTDVSIHQRPLPSSVALQRNTFGELSDLTCPQSRRILPVFSLEVIYWEFVLWVGCEIIYCEFILATAIKSVIHFFFWNTFYQTVGQSLFFAVVDNIKLGFLSLNNYGVSSSYLEQDFLVWTISSCCERFWTAVSKDDGYPLNLETTFKLLQNNRTSLHKILNQVLFMVEVQPVKKNKHAAPVVFTYLQSCETAS